VHPGRIGGAGSGRRRGDTLGLRAGGREKEAHRQRHSSGGARRDARERVVDELAIDAIEQPHG